MLSFSLVGVAVKKDTRNNCRYNVSFLQCRQKQYAHESSTTGATDAFVRW